MKAILYLIILAGIAYGGYYVYENHMGGMSGSISRTIDRTADFATDAKVKGFDANSVNQ